MCQLVVSPLYLVHSPQSTLTHAHKMMAAARYQEIVLPQIQAASIRMISGLSTMAQRVQHNAVYCRQLSIIHTDFKPENVMLLDTLTPRHWEMTLQPSRAPSAALGDNEVQQQQSHSGASSGLTKNQKKKAKRKAKKAAAAAASQEVGVVLGRSTPSSDKVLTAQ